MPYLVLWNADENHAIEHLYDYGTIDLCKYEDINLNLEAYFEDTTRIESVTITMTDYYTDEVVAMKTESAVPYMLGGDINRPFSVNPLDALKVPGYYHITVDPSPGAPTTFIIYIDECDVSFFNPIACPPTLELFKESEFLHVSSFGRSCSSPRPT